MEEIMLIARVLHSWTRWVFLIVALVAVIIFVQGWFQKRPWTQRAGTMLMVYGSILGVQWLFGLALMIAWGSIAGFNQRHFWEHLAVQTIAVLVANGHHAWRRREMADAKRWRNGLLVILISLALVVVGIIALPVTIQWRFFVP